MPAKENDPAIVSGDSPARLAVDLRRFPWIRRLATDYAYHFDAVAPFFSGDPADARAWSDVIGATQHLPRSRAEMARVIAAQQDRRGAPEAARLAGRRLGDGRTVAIVTGHAVPPADLRVAEILPPDGLGPSISLAGKVSEQRVWMDFKTGIVQQLQIIGGRAAAIATYRRDADGRLTGFDISAAERYVTGTVRYRNMTTDVGLTADGFVLTLPKDAKTQPIR